MVLLRPHVSACLQPRLPHTCTVYSTRPASLARLTPKRTINPEPNTHPPNPQVALRVAAQAPQLWARCRHQREAAAVCRPAGAARQRRWGALRTSCCWAWRIGVGCGLGGHACRGQGKTCRSVEPAEHAMQARQVSEAGWRRQGEQEQRGRQGWETGSMVGRKARVGNRQGWETGKGGKQEAWCRLCWVGVKVGMGSCASSVEAVTAWRGAWVC